jgi:hypothetical protein
VTLAGLVGAEVAEAMTAHGFRRKRNQFILDGPAGQLGVVGFYPLAPGDRPRAFSWQYGVVTPALMELQQWRGEWRTQWPSPSYALLMAQVRRPADQPQPWNADPYKWIIPEDAVPVVGAGVRRALIDEVLPNLQAWFQPELLDAAIASWSVGCGRVYFSTKARARVLALLPLGRDSEAVRSAMAKLDQDDMIWRWLNDRAV